MKVQFQIKAQIKGLNVLQKNGGGDDAEDGGGTDANPIEPDYSGSNDD